MFKATRNYLPHNDNSSDDQKRSSKGRGRQTGIVIGKFTKEREWLKNIEHGQNDGNQKR